MRVSWFHRFGGPEVLVCEETGKPTPGAGEALVRVRAVGINHVDLDHRAGTSRIPVTFPHILGREFAGEVAVLGVGGERGQQHRLAGEEHARAGRSLDGHHRADVRRPDDDGALRLSGEPGGAGGRRLDGVRAGREARRAERRPAPDVAVDARRPVERRRERAAARIGGDEFAMLLESLDSPEDAVVVAERIIDAVSKPVVLQGREVTVGEGRKSATLGRAEDNDVVVKGNLISRVHARVEVSRDKFTLVDESTNGTFVQTNAGEEIFVRRDSTQLVGEGVIGLGRVAQPGTALAVHFVVEE